MRPKKFPYPISVKAYHTFIVRIRLVIKDKSECETMEKAFHYYLAGREDICFGMLNDECRIAFAFLRHEIDNAVRRSESARERALKRKAQKKDTSEVAPADEGDENITDSDDKTCHPAEARALRPKRKWLPSAKSVRKKDIHRDTMNT